MEKCNDSGCKKATDSEGIIYVVGTGPGDKALMTQEALDAVACSDVVIGYSTYLDQLFENVDRGDKEVISSSMMQEVDRCEKTFEIAESGKNVAIISGGDAGIYAMAGLILEIASTKNYKKPIKVIPGIAALNACAAKLGAPLMHDFAAISLSDLLTPWETITKRLEAAASADFVIVLYNPKSKKRTEHIVQAREIVSRYRSKETPVGIVTAANREKQTVVISDLGNMLDNEINMQSTVIIGNSTTFNWNGFMITPRGYKEKYNL